MEADIGAYLADVEKTATGLSRLDVIRRLWQRDHTIWKPNPAEITNRLGWLNIAAQMREQVPKLESFADEIQEADFRHVVLLGMGGSSLAPEVMRQTLQPKGSAELIVLDSTLPARVQEVTEVIDPKHTLFLVSSKSGTTVESITLFEYFLSLTQSALPKGRGKETAGQNFIAITDPETPLAKRAGAEGFRNVFINPPDIGGRYSVLSYFGLVPAALSGVNIRVLLDRAERMREQCTTNIVWGNPGAWLGTIMGTLASRGRDKLTLVTSPAIGSLGLWIEQLIAESTGKEGKGILPVVGEPLVEPDDYSDDRFFVYLRLQSDDNSLTDGAIQRVKSSGQPVVVLELQDLSDLGGEFFRWEFATAIAGAILGVNPFDQPNVEATKKATERVLQEFVSSGNLPQFEGVQPLAELLSKVKKGKYLAILAYLRQSPEVDKALGHLRRKFLERYHIATTLGYGPRYLHSTGQLHKGGPPTGLFLQLTSAHEKDLPIPGRPYTFGVLADAQAIGDFQALQSLGRDITKIQVSRGDEAGIAEVIGQL